jgi:SAM-dependent methyltransferase
MHSDADTALLVERSIRAYRRAHRRYERRHPEIFNPVEQARLRGELERALADVASGAEPPRALDLGCGTGNLTRHLVELGAQVVAADVSPAFLRTVRRRYRVETFALNGRDLGGLDDASLDLVCAYSVLHHIPDYLGAVGEICRVLRPGGVAYLDHEANESFWDTGSCFWRMLGELPGDGRWRRCATRVRQVFNPAHPWDVEGDIHVWPADHIEWDRIEERLTAGGCEIVRRVDYLNYSSDYPDDVWERYAGSCTNMRLAVARRG